MHSQQWQSAEGMIIDVQPAHGRHEHDFTIQLRKPDGRLIQRTVKHKIVAPYPVGTKVRAEFSELNEIRFDPNYPGESAVIATMDMSDQIREASASFGPGPSFGGFDGLGGGGGAGSAFAFGAAAGLAPGSNIGAFLGALNATGSAAQVIGPDGQPVQVDPEEITRITQAMTHGDPAERDAAMQRLHQIRAAVRAQGGSGTVVSVGGAAFSVPGGSSFAPGSQVQHGTPEQRLQALQELHSKGLLTESEYEAKRQQIIDGV